MKNIGSPPSLSGDGFDNTLESNSRGWYVSKRRISCGEPSANCGGSMLGKVKTTNRSTRKFPDELEAAYFVS